MKLAKSKIWSHLSEDEKVALTLALGNGKSTWEAGTIMKKSHYKFLEILSRGKHFIKLFTQQYSLYGKIIPDSVSINPVVKDYLDLVICDRIKPTKALKRLNHPLFSITQHRTEFLRREIEKWAVSDETSERLFYTLVMEFDRWNNWRILPKDLQEPHAFKRRNKNVVRYYLKNWVTRGKESAQEFADLIAAPKNLTKSKEAYVGVIIDCRSFVYEIVKVNSTKSTTKILCKDQRYFMFKDPKDAIKLMDLVTEYFSKDQRKSAEGLYFWPQVRVLIKRALNHDEIMGIVPERTHTIHNPYKVKPENDREILIKRGIDL